MAWNDYLSLLQFGLSANKPTAANVDKPELPKLYIATDTGTISVWNPTSKAWMNGSAVNLVSSIVSAGATQGNATAITTNTVLVTTATASSKGVMLPAAATGLEVTIANIGPTFGTKVYPALHQFINAGASSAADATVLAALKSTVYLAKDALHWITLRSA